jgi:hypothetical protein
VLAGGGVISVLVSASSITLSRAAGTGGANVSSDNPTSASGGESVGSVQTAVKPLTSDEDGLESQPRLANPGGYSGTNMTQEQLKCLGFRPRREPPFYTRMPYHVPSCLTWQIRDKSHMFSKKKIFPPYGCSFLLQKHPAI